VEETGSRHSNGAAISSTENLTSFLSRSEFKAAQSTQKQQRLKYLLEQATVYSRFLASKFIKSRDEDQGPVPVAGEAESSTHLPASKTLVTQPALVSGGSLKQYQLDGLEWLVSLYENGLNGILADEMGLGKTLQCISFLAFLREKGVYGPFLITAPLSTLANWEAEIHRFTPTVPCLVYHGNKAERADLRKAHFAQGKGNRPDPASFPIIITSYEIVMADKAYLDTFRWKFIIVDEGHRIKNLNCKLIKTLKQFDSANRLLLTGTPLQNNLSELWSLLNFLLPDIFDDLETFQRWFDVSEMVREEEASMSAEAISEQHRISVISNLHTILKPFVLRRLKSEVERNLPPKQEYWIYCGLSVLQKQYYTAALARTLPEFIQAQVNANEIETGRSRQALKKVKNGTKRLRANPEMMLEDEHEEELDDEMFLARLEDACVGDKTTERPASEAVDSTLRHMKLQNLLMQLRKVCNHPYLFFYPYNRKTGALKVNADLIELGGKMVILDQLLHALRDRGHRTLIFCQMTMMLDIIQDYLEWSGQKYCRIDGSTPLPEREDELSAFRKDVSIPVFLLSTRAAGLGINLVAADTVIFYDSDWNPQMDLQAQDRAHRIGQTRPVLVFRLVTSGSIEAKILERATSKRRLERLVMLKCKPLYRFLAPYANICSQVQGDQTAGSG
jgi:ATP-dependent DNA helicase